MAVIHPSARDIVRITRDNGVVSYAVVLFAWQGDGTVLLGLHDTEFADPLHATDQFSSMIYTYSDAINHGDWEVVGQLAIGDTEKYTRRVVGATLWEGNRQLPNASPQDMAEAPTMRVAGTELAKQYIHFLVEGGEDCAFFRMNTRQMQAFLRASGLAPSDPS